MKREEYLRKALLLVSNPYTKAQVQRELEDHIEDEISFYTDAGYEREKAENMAMSRMGAPDKMARELGRLHRNLPGRVLGFSALAACVGLSMLYWFSDQWSDSLYHNYAGLAGLYADAWPCCGCFGSHHSGLSLGVEV